MIKTKWMTDDEAIRGYSSATDLSERELDLLDRLTRVHTAMLDLEEICETLEKTVIRLEGERDGGNP